MPAPVVVGLEVDFQVTIFHYLKSESMGGPFAAGPFPGKFAAKGGTVGRRRGVVDELLDSVILTFFGVLRWRCGACMGARVSSC